MKSLVLPILLLCAAFAASPASGAQSTPAAGNADRGKQLYVRNYCWSCHGYVGSGASTGPRLSQLRLDAQAFTAFIRKPRSMPKYSPVLVSDADALDIYAYIKTFPAPPAVDSIELLKVFSK